MKLMALGPAILAAVLLTLDLEAEEASAMPKEDLGFSLRCMLPSKTCVLKLEKKLRPAEYSWLDNSTELYDGAEPCESDGNKITSSECCEIGRKSLENYSQQTEGTKNRLLNACSLYCKYTGKGKPNGGRTCGYVGCDFRYLEHSSCQQTFESGDVDVTATAVSVIVILLLLAGITVFIIWWWRRRRVAEGRTGAKQQSVRATFTTAQGVANTSSTPGDVDSRGRNGAHQYTYTDNASGRQPNSNPPHDEEESVYHELDDIRDRKLPPLPASTDEKTSAREPPTDEHTTRSQQVPQDTEYSHLERGGNTFEQGTEYTPLSPNSAVAQPTPYQDKEQGTEGKYFILEEQGTEATQDDKKQGAIGNYFILEEDASDKDKDQTTGDTTQGATGNYFILEEDASKKDNKGQTAGDTTQGATGNYFILEESSKDDNDQTTGGQHFILEEDTTATADQPSTTDAKDPKSAPSDSDTIEDYSHLDRPGKGDQKPADQTSDYSHIESTNTDG